MQDPFNEKTDHGHDSDIPLVLDKCSPKARIHVRLVEEDAWVQGKADQEQGFKVGSDIMSCLTETRLVATKCLRRVKRQSKHICKALKHEKTQIVS